MSRLRGVQVNILCEDPTHERFIVRLLKRQDCVRIRADVAPKGKGDASDWVLENVTRLIRAQRAHASYMNTALIIVIDGDDKGVERRKQMIDARLRAAGHEARSEKDKIAICVPTWSGETWLLWLSGRRDVVESTSLKHAWEHAAKRGELTIQGAVDAFLRGADPHETEIVPSLADAREELRRIEPD